MSRAECGYTWFDAEAGVDHRCYGPRQHPGAHTCCTPDGIMERIEDTEASA